MHYVRRRLNHLKSTWVRKQSSTTSQGSTEWWRSTFPRSLKPASDFELSASYISRTGVEQITIVVFLVWVKHSFTLVMNSFDSGWESSYTSYITDPQQNMAQQGVHQNSNHQSSDGASGFRRVLLWTKVKLRQNDRRELVSGSTGLPLISLPDATLENPTSNQDWKLGSSWWRPGMRRYIDRRYDGSMALNHIGPYVHRADRCATTSKARLKPNAHRTYFHLLITNDSTASIARSISPLTEVAGNNYIGQILCAHPALSFNLSKCCRLTLGNPRVPSSTNRYRSPSATKQNHVFLVCIDNFGGHSLRKYLQKYLGSPSHLYHKTKKLVRNFCGPHPLWGCVVAMIVEIFFRSFIDFIKMFLAIPGT